MTIQPKLPADEPETSPRSGLLAPKLIISGIADKAANVPIASFDRACGSGPA
jgi:hypothetical protein